MTEQMPNPLQAVVYAILVILALAAGIVTLGNQAGWWSIDF